MFADVIPPNPLPMTITSYSSRVSFKKSLGTVRWENLRSRNVAVAEESLWPDKPRRVGADFGDIGLPWVTWLFRLTSFVGHTAFAGRFDVLDVLVQRTAGGFQRRGGPGFLPRFQFRRGHVDVQGIRFGIDRHDVTVGKQTDRSAVLRFRRNVTDDEPVAATAKPPVGDHCHVAAQTGTH